MMARVCSYPSLILPSGFRGLVICSYASFIFFSGVLRAANSSTNCLDMVVPASLLYVYFDANHLVLPSVSLWAINFFFFCQMFLFPFAESCQKQEHTHHGSVKLG